MPLPFGYTRTRRLFCRACYRFVFAGQWRPDYVRHGVAAVVTLGFWLLVVALAVLWYWVLAPGYRCPNCGGRCRGTDPPVTA